MRFKKPKNGHFYHYCYECRHWQYERSVGVAHLGTCKAVDLTEQDAYDKPCGLFELKRNKK